MIIERLNDVSILRLKNNHEHEYSVASLVPYKINRSVII